MRRGGRGRPRAAADEAPASLATRAARWSALEFERWLLHGLDVYFKVEAPAARETAFWPLVVHPQEGLADQLLGAVELIPGKVVVLGEAVGEALAHWVPALGRPALVELLALVRRMQPAGVVPVLQDLLRRRPFGADADGEDVLRGIVEVVCSFAVTERVDRLLDEIRFDRRVWRTDFSAMWLRAKVRGGGLGWIEGLCGLEPEFAELQKGGFDLRRFLGRLIDERPGLAAVALDVERYFLGGELAKIWRHVPKDAWHERTNAPPWFFGALFEGERAPLKLVPGHAGTHTLLRVRVYGESEELVLGELGDGSERVARARLWRTIAGITTPRAPVGPDLPDAVSGVDLLAASIAPFLALQPSARRDQVEA
jgi:hypothetical protein